MKTYSLKLLVTGGEGQVAQALCRHAVAGKFQIHALSHSEMDISQPSSIERVLTAQMPDCVINTAAYTAVDRAEAERGKADQANVLGAKHIAHACSKHRIPLIHLSTDYLFDGTKTAPYAEEDDVNPINHYGKSKWLGEEAVREACDSHIILRVSGVFSEHKTNFLKSILRLAQEKGQLNIVADQLTCPTYAGDIALAIFSIIEKFSQWGTFHYCSAPAVSWHAFASAIIETASRHMSLSVKKINAISTAEYPVAAKRPAYSVLDCSKIKKLYHIEQPSWQSGIERALNGLIHSSS
ncbi:dTDP-4-dehydrorhamnose reductase [Aquicella lusitana]|uniref:dTDP-4-dehydrorhamnose reductase n=1 Tax=Aquicella lusitana TaxID=254246 RepID=A0A370GQM8_9COXI|nr:dTDP-4-dehydrorhamnose reductase [Aquicella lusitana]RDI44794.1 dTDP-4-dehydrorhamnose reductase [Aquicella lusitana]VVC72991.1 dTDP-4-dehydrorhamnose reductase [Aquicella lusitana]